MRLGDLDKLKQELISDYAYAAADIVDSQPTIELENLPVVKELREQLEKVTAERDKIKQMAKETCEFCMSLTRRSGVLPGCEICPLNGLRKGEYNASR